MVLRRILLTCTLALAAVHSLANFRGADRVLPVVRETLEKAQRSATDGKLDYSDAYTNSVLLTDKHHVYVSGLPTELQSRVLKRAFDTWNEAISDAFDYELVPSPDQADIVIRFERDVYCGTEDARGVIEKLRYLGFRNNKLDGWVTAKIGVSTRENNGSDASEDRLVSTLIHELGHYLGLDDSNRCGNIMGPALAKPLLRPSLAEVEALQNLRDEANEIRWQAAFTSLNLNRRRV